MKKTNLHFFFGEDTYSLLQKINHWRDEFARKHGDTNLETLNGKEITANYIKQAIDTMPFLGEKRLIIVKDFMSEGDPEQQKKTAEILKDIPETCVLVFVETIPPDKRTSLYKKLKKEATFSEFAALKGFELNDWIIKETRNHKGEIDHETASYLASLTGGNLWLLSNEIKKLCAYCEKRPITLVEVELLVNANLHKSIFQLTDALAQKNIKTSLETLHNLIANGEDLIRIFFMIIRQFRLIIQIKNLREQGIRENGMVSKLKQHPFTIRNTIKQSDNFENETLKKIYGILLKIDIRLKTGGLKHQATDQRDLTLALDEFIVNICK